MTEPQWPAQRRRERYESLLNIDVAALLAGGGLWIDVGPGVDALPMQRFLHRRDVTLVCVGPHPRTLPAPIDFTLSHVPADDVFFARWTGQARLVTDVYGSISYGDDPLLALAYCALLLEPGGTFAGFTELERLGGLATWDRAIQFFRRELQIALTLHAVSIVEDASKSFATALRIQATRESRTDLTLTAVGEQLHRQVGTPRPEGTIWEARDKSARIWRVEYG